MINHPNHSKKKASIERAVLVTTTHRGVFFGYASDSSGNVIKLRGARNCPALGSKHTLGLFLAIRVLCSPQLTQVVGSRYYQRMAGVVANISPKWKENLPDNCPPKGAGTRAYEGVWRYVKSKTVTDKDFASYYALGKKPPPTVPPCRWASSSLFLTKTAAYLLLPKLRGRYKYIAKVNITEKCGASILLRSHIDFWRYDTFTPSVVAVEDIPEEDDHG